MINAQSEISQFADETAGLGDKRAVVLVQLPPSLLFKSDVARSFFRYVRAQINCAIVCEPRHLTWLSSEAEALPREYEIGRVAADPSINETAAAPGGCLYHVYYRWHGSPRTYYSAYEAATLRTLRIRLSDAAHHAKTVWCIFDNTAEGAGVSNALELTKMLDANED